MAGVRELQQNASALLRRVAKGETIEITTRGRPVAVLAPLPADGSPYERLVTTGEIEPAENPDADWPEPLPRTPGVVAGTEQLRRLREHER